MFNEIERREEIKETWNDRADRETFGDFLDRLIVQEKAMIECEVKEFAKRFIDEYTQNFYLEDTTYSPEFIKQKILNKILKEYGVEI